MNMNFFQEEQEWMLLDLVLICVKFLIFFKKIIVITDGLDPQ
jgi:hypothetical protein